MNALFSQIKIYLYIGAIALISILFVFAMFEHNRYARVKAEYDGFVAQAQAIAAIQLAENQRKERENAQRIKDAVRDRDIALTQLRHATKDSSRLRTTITALTASSTGKVCYRSEAIDAALSGITGLIIEGDDSIITNRAWFESWPR